MGFLRDLADWVEGFAGTDWAAPVLAATAFFESIFFPIPPDPLLIAISIPQPNMAIWLALLVTLSSVAGAAVGHLIGRRFGHPLLYRMFKREKIERVECLFKRYGAWTILVAAFTPIPYKIFAIAAGVLDMDRRTFLIASLIGRGARFLLIGALVMAFGEQVQSFLDDNFEILTLAAAGGLVLAAGAFLLIYRRRRASRQAN